MSQRVFVRVIGFTDVERHALNTVFRLSQQRDVAYSLWMPDAPEAPGLVLVDSLSYEALMTVESPSLDTQIKIIWVGESAPANAWRVFDRPLHWPHVVQAMDGLYGPPPDLDFDLEHAPSLDLDLDFSLDPGQDANGPDTQPPEPAPVTRRALIVAADLSERLYLRARLALADLTLADEAQSAADAMELARAESYAVAVIDFDLPDMPGWDFVKQLRQRHPAIAHVVLTKRGATLADQARAWFAGIDACLAKPTDPERLRGLLEKV